MLSLQNNFVTKSHQKLFYSQLVVLHPLPTKIEGYETPSREQSCEFSIAYESLSDAIIFCDSHRKECKGIHDGTFSEKDLQITSEYAATVMLVSKG